MMSSNLVRLKTIAQGLRDLNEEIAFVGGSVAELYADDPAATEIRMTEDVDCVIELASYRSLYELEEEIRKLGFTNDTRPEAPICRWIYKGETVDIMPDDKSILGFTNEWYKPAFTYRKKVILPDGTSISIFPALYYVATKIEAIKGRGGNDLRFSHDLEDLIYVLNNCQQIIAYFDEEQNLTLKEYISHWARHMLERQNGREEIECVLPYGDFERLDYIVEILTYFAKGT
ncbi:MAG: hypothetical protein K2N35_15705 [Muribaculaceae bacterium]|nr:hypothetical protein [Muribaculaceae bacterium]